MLILTILTVSFLLIFTLSYGLFFVYVRRHARKPWNIKIDKTYQPEISILVPVHNEEENIQAKLANLQAVNYPKEKIEVIIADDASDDQTLLRANETIQKGLGFRTKIFKQQTRGGKAVTMNAALTVASAPIVIVSDADTLWPNDILQNAMPYLADPSIGALTGQGKNKQTDESWVTRNEDNYLQLSNIIRLGESKIHSTLRFEGGFCAYKRVAFTQFDCESGSDDSGTALEAIQNNYRTILVPEVVFYTSFPTSLKGKARIKVRRANQLISLWIKCLKFMSKRRLVLPKRIVIPDVFLFIVNPVVFLLLAASSVAMIVLYPLSIFSLIIAASIVGLLIFARTLFIELIVDNLLLFYASAGYLLGRRYVAWKKTKN
jgi:cellulose synthase/poly-beta-1,6-N-acetylglucosamine synthase-like glycosyltransferase